MRVDAEWGDSMQQGKPILCAGTTPAVQRTMRFRRLAVDHVNRATEVLESPAGKSVNVAQVLATLGKGVIATGFLGGDSGRFIGDQLQRRGVTLDFVEVPFPTRTCTTAIDIEQGTTTELVEESHVIPAELWQKLLDRIAAATARSAAMVLSGGLPPNAPQDFYACCCELANRHGIPVVLDTRGEPLRLAMPYRPALVKPNRAELGEMMSEPVDTDVQLREAIRHLLQRGAQTALITLGAKGAVLAAGGAFWTLAAPKVVLNNPIGSGDSVAAGYTAGLVDGLPIVDCAILGIACGSANAMTPVPGCVHPGDVQRLRREIRAVEM